MHVLLLSFIGQHLQVLRFPVDEMNALTAGDFSLQEVISLVRFIAKRLDSPHWSARYLGKVLRSHVLMQRFLELALCPRQRVVSRDVIVDTNVSRSPPRVQDYH